MSERVLIGWQIPFEAIEEAFQRGNQIEGGIGVAQVDWDELAQTMIVYIEMDAEDANKLPLEPTMGSACYFGTDEVGDLLA